MKKVYLVLLLCLTAFSAMAQPLSKEEYLGRYQRLVSRVGAAGVGVETLIGQWAEAWPDDVQMLLARFSFFYNKSQTAKVIQLSQERYLGRAPLLPMKDSTGAVRNYFEDTVFDDELFGRADEAISRAISLEPLRLDRRLVRITALTAYEKGSPDMALSELKALVDKHFNEHPAWVYEGLQSVGDEEFKALMQEYCYTFFRLGTPGAAEAFKALSEHLLRYCKDDPLYVNNLGSYYLVCKKEPKKALKYYNSILKKHPDDLTAIRNTILLARSTKDARLEKKYLPLMVKYGETESERAGAAARLQALGRK